MRSTAETARTDAVERSRAEAKAYVEQIQARMGDESTSFRNAAEADAATIEERAKAEAEQVRVETEHRIARRRERLKQELEEYKAGVAAEAQRVQERVVAFEDELTKFFEKILAGDADPTVFANMASMMPSSPDFEGRGDSQPKQAEAPSGSSVVPPVQTVLSAAPVPSQAGIPAAQRAPLLPGKLYGAGAVRGRLVNEWYGEVERLNAIGEVGAARPYEELALIYRASADSAAEFNILERFARQQHAPGAQSARLLERMTALKKSGKR
jgi:F0F1-type ATP synthase membrane subunit b/b'